MLKDVTRRDCAGFEVYRAPQKAACWMRARVSVAILIVAIISLTAFSARWAMLGNPLVHVDEEFYLLVGSRMLDGAVPYVDIWDRKPIGLFIIFAGARSLGGNGVLQYQILALISVIATALLLFRMARKIAGTVPALGSSMLYVLYLDLAGGEAGQSPVWYNLPVASAVSIIFFARSSPRTQGGSFRWPGAAAMILLGIALQIKYSVIFEGIFAGCVLIGMSLRRGHRKSRLIVDVGLWIACALLPTVLAAGVYAVLGHLHEWLFANLLSIIHRGSEPVAMVRWRLVEMGCILAPLVLSVPLRRWVGVPFESSELRDDLLFLDAWAASSLLGVMLFGTWFNHYALPTFAPFATIAAPLITRRWGRIYFALLLIGSAIWGQHMLRNHIKARGSADLLAKVVMATGHHDNCIFVYDGLVALYDATHSCLPTSHVYPTHFAGLVERDATGISQAGLVTAVMARRPDRVTTMEPAYSGENLDSRAAVYRALRANYVRIAQIPRLDRTIDVYGLRGTVMGGPDGSPR